MLVQPPATAADAPVAIGLFVLLTRFAQMRVQIDKAGRDDQSGGVENVRLFGNLLAPIKQTYDTAVFNQEASTTGVNLLRGIDHVTICNQQLHS